MQNNVSIFAIRLKAARKAKKITQEQLGIMAGIDEFSASTRINRYEKGIHEPHLAIVEKIAVVLDLPVAYFYSTTDMDAVIIRLIQHLTEQQKQTLLEELTKHR